MSLFSVTIATLMSGALAAPQFQEAMRQKPRWLKPYRALDAAWQSQLRRLANAHPTAAGSGLDLPLLRRLHGRIQRLWFGLGLGWGTLAGGTLALGLAGHPLGFVAGLALGISGSYLVLLYRSHTRPSWGPADRRQRELLAASAQELLGRLVGSASATLRRDLQALQRQHPMLQLHTLAMLEYRPGDVDLLASPEVLPLLVSALPSEEVLVVHERLLQPDVPLAIRLHAVAKLPLWGATPFAPQAKRALVMALQEVGQPDELVQALRQALLRLPNAIVEAQQLAQHNQPEVREQGLLLLQADGSSQAKQLLARMVHDADPRLARMAGAATQAKPRPADELIIALNRPLSRDIERALPSVEAYPDIRLVPALLNAWQWAQVQDPPLARVVQRVTRHVVNATTHPWSELHPRVYCRQCQARTATFRAPWISYVACRKCRDVAHLMGPVTTVVGRLGGAPPVHEVSGVVYATVWDDLERRARPADLDILEILPQPDLNVDWALSALLQTWQNEGPQFRLPTIQLLGEVPLQPNTLRLLHDAQLTLLLANGQTHTWESASRSTPAA